MAECDMSLDGPINDTNIQYKFEENAKVPDWHKADQLAMSSAAEELNQGVSETNPAGGQSGI